MVSIPRRERGIAMRSYAMSKLSASLVVLLLALSAMVFLPAVNSGQTASGVNIYVPVASGGTPVTNAVVNLTEVHTGAVVTATYSVARTCYVASSPAPGYYSIDVSANGYFGQPGATSVVFTGLRNITVQPIALTALPSKLLWYNVTVAASTGGIVSGATVGFYNNTHRQFVSSGVTNSLGYVVLTMYKTAAASDVSLVVMKIGYEMTVTPILVNSNVTMTSTIKPSTKVSVYVTDCNGIPAQDVVAYLISRDPSVPWVKRIMKATGNLFAFDAYPGSFTMVIDSPGNNASVTYVNVTGPISLQLTLTKQTQRVEHLAMTFGSDYSQFSLAVSTVWSYDNAYPGLMYNNMGCLRAQIDLVFGNGDGYLSSSEIAAFNATLAAFGTQYVTSANLLVVNQTVFTNGTATNLSLGLAPGPVTSTAGVSYSYDCVYTAVGTIPAGRFLYVLNATARLNSADVHYKYHIGLVSGYELVANATPPGGVVSGYLYVNYDSNVTGTGSEVIQLTVEKFIRPIAKGVVQLPSNNASAVLNKTRVLQRYIVRTNSNVTFSAAGSSDPNGNPLTYIWNFSDSTPVVTTTKSLVVHNFTSAFAMNRVNLTVRDVAGWENHALINITSDSLVPTPVISASSAHGKAANGRMSVNQSDVVSFNATKSWDDAVTLGDHLGVIDHVQLYYGDNTSSGAISWTNPNQNVTHVYASAGDFTVTLKVTDAVGHFKNATMTVHVNDTTAPVVKFTVKNATWGTSLLENTTVHFDASSTRDNLNNYTLLNYSWNFGDHHWLNGTGEYNVTHNYTRIGAFLVQLRVWDLAGNNAVHETRINVAAGPRPNVIITAVTFEPLNFTQGEVGYIVVNLTNTGNAPATNVLTSFYIVPSSGGALQKIGETSSMLNGTTPITSISVGGKVQVRFAYSPSNTGTLTLKINVTSANQLYPYSYTASGSKALTVKEAPYKAILLWIGVIVVIVAIPSLLYVRSRLSKRERKGPRREKKEPKGENP